MCYRSMANNMHNQIQSGLAIFTFRSSEAAFHHHLSAAHRILMTAKTKEHVFVVAAGNEAADNDVVVCLPMAADDGFLLRD